MCSGLRLTESELLLIDVLTLCWSSTWSCVLTLDCSDFLGDLWMFSGFSGFLINITSEACVRPERQCSSLILQTTVDPAAWLEQWGQCLRTTHSLPPCYSIDVHWGNPTHHIHSPLLLYKNNNSTPQCTFIKPWHSCRLKKRSLQHLISVRKLRAATILDHLCTAHSEKISSVRKQVKQEWRTRSCCLWVGELRLYWKQECVKHTNAIWQGVSATRTTQNFINICLKLTCDFCVCSLDEHRGRSVKTEGKWDSTSAAPGFVQRYKSWQYLWSVCRGEWSVTWACIPGKDGSPVSGKAATVQQALGALLSYNWKFACAESNQCYKN